MTYINNCPICKHTEFTVYLNLKDHFLTKENFQITKCNQCGFLFTNPRPDDQDLVRYYNSPDYLSHGGVVSSLKEMIYQFARKFTIKNKYALIKQHLGKGKILDYGCGTAEFLAYCKAMGWETQGIEPNPKAREIAISKHQLPVSTEDQLFTFDNNSFNIVTLWHVLEHIPDVNARLEQFYRILKPGGILIIAVPNADAHDAKHYKDFWAAYDVPRHLYHFTSVTLKKLVLNLPFKYVTTRPLKLDAFYISLLSEQYLGNKFPYLKAISQGMKSNQYAKSNSVNYSSQIFVFVKP